MTFRIIFTIFLETKVSSGLLDASSEETELEIPPAEVFSQFSQLFGYTFLKQGFSPLPPAVQGFCAMGRSSGCKKFI